jgi:hypothetical protein
VSFQSTRRDLATALEYITEGDGWKVSLSTETSEIYHQTIVVGHPLLVEPDTFQSFQAELEITAWVSEADDVNAVDLLYDLISPGDRSLVLLLPSTDPIAGRVLLSRAKNMGRRREGPSGFLAVDIDVTLLVLADS